jgi:hypothetical protein
MVGRSAECGTSAPSFKVQSREYGVEVQRPFGQTFITVSIDRHKETKFNDLQLSNSRQNQGCQPEYE